MKTFILIMLITATTMLATTAQTKTSTNKVEKNTVQYVCPDHPNEISDHEGKCSKCGKSLVKETIKNYKGQQSILLKTVYSCPNNPTELQFTAQPCVKCVITIVQV